jgi:hypothetical protein
LLADGAAAIVNDTFLCCFQSQPVQSWNWNPYLFLFSAVGYAVKEILFWVKCVPAYHILMAPLCFGRERDRERQKILMVRRIHFSCSGTRNKNP